MSTPTGTSFEFFDSVLKALKGGEKTVYYGDTKCQGLRLTVTSGGTKTFRFVARAKSTGKPVNEKIGRYPDVTLKYARELADEARRMLGQRKEVKFLLATGSEKTFGDTLDEYAAEHLARLRTGKETKQALTTVAKRQGWMQRSMRAITKEDVREAMQHILVDREAPQMASRTQVLFSGFFNWAVGAGHIDVNPISGMKLMGGPGNIGDRVLEDEEIRILWRVLSAPTDYGFGPVYARALKLELTTTCRPGMATKMLLAQVHTDGKHGTYWMLSREAMKKDRKYVVPLNRFAAEAVAEAVAEAGPLDKWVCPTTSSDFRDDGKHMRLRSLNRRLNELIARLQKMGLKIEAFTPRDLRRTAATLLRRHKRPGGGRWRRSEVASLLSHQPEDEEMGGRQKSRGTVMDHYDHWDAYEEKREMTDHLAAILTGIIAEGGGVRLAA